MRSSMLLLASALILPVAAEAVVEPSQAGRAAYVRFKGIDADRDRALSAAELRAKGNRSAAQALFELLDGDRDGSLALKELEAAGGGGRLARFQAYDADRDGKVSRREFPSTWDSRLFDALDGDGDGRLEMGDLRPEFAGWRPDRPPPPVPQARARAEPATDDRPWCWVPNFGDADRWLIEVPVVSSGSCRTLGR